MILYVFQGGVNSSRRSCLRTSSDTVDRVLPSFLSIAIVAWTCTTVCTYVRTTTTATTIIMQCDRLTDSICIRLRLVMMMMLGPCRCQFSWNGKRARGIWLCRNNASRLSLVGRQRQRQRRRQRSTRRRETSTMRYNLAVRFLPCHPHFDQQQQQGYYCTTVHHDWMRRNAGWIRRKKKKRNELNRMNRQSVITVITTPTQPSPHSSFHYVLRTTYYVVQEDKLAATMGEKPQTSQILSTTSLSYIGENDEWRVCVCFLPLALCGIHLCLQ